MLRWNLRQAAAVILPWCLLAACGSPSSQPFGQEKAQIQVDVARQLVSIRAKDVPVQSLLLELSKQAGFSLCIADGGQLGRMTLVATDISLEESIHRVLGRIPHTLVHTLGEDGNMVVAAVEVHCDALAVAGSSQSIKGNMADERASVGLETADFGWGVDQRDDGGSTNNVNRIAELALDMETLSVDTIKQLVREAKDPALRLSMLDALMERGDHSSVRPLFLDALQDADATVREASLEYLRGSGEKIPLSVLAEAVSNETDQALRAEMLKVLADQTLTEVQTKEDLATAMMALQRMLADDDLLLREQAQWSLEDLAQSDSLAGSR